MKKLSIFLKGGIVYDGSGSAPSAADVGVAGERIHIVPRGERADSGEVIDVGGLALCPGFIDTHAHSDFTALSEPPESKIYQGVTTEINGNCGLSAAPLLAEALRQREADLKEHGIEERWSAFEEYFGLLERRGLYINFATLAGHGNIRASVMGYENRKPSPGEMKAMKELLSAALRAGAIGLSTGLIYPPGIYSDTEELIELASAGRNAPPASPFIYTSHMRSEGARLIEAIKEIIAIGKGAGVRAHISHVKTAGKKNWHKIDEAIGLIDEARQTGVALTADRYPYTAASTDLDSVLPAWAYEGGSGEELRRLNSPETRLRLKGEMEGANPDDWHGVRVSTVTLDRNRWMEGKSVADIAAALSKDPADAIMDVLIEEKLRVGAIFYSMSEENIRRFLSLPYVMIGSDSSARAMSGKGKPHPRAFGTFPRFLSRYAPIIPAAGGAAGEAGLASAIRKTAMLPAQTFGLKDRGRIKEGFMADIVVFDPGALKDTADFENPYQRPSGVRHVIVNGSPVLRDGEMTGLKPGRVLRHGT